MNSRKMVNTCIALLIVATLSSCHKKNSGLELQSMDSSVKPCADFYEYACGDWMKNNPIPADQNRWGRFDVLAQQNQDSLKSILDKKDYSTPEQKKLGDLYVACMDTTAIDQLGTQTLQPYFSKINSLTNTTELLQQLAIFQKQGIGAVFGFWVQPDPENSSVLMLNLDQGGLSLPDVSDYGVAEKDFKTKSLFEKAIETQGKFKEYMIKMFVAAGDSKEKADQEAAVVLKVETALAKISMTKVERRDTHATNKKMSLPELSSMAPNIDWSAYFAALGAPQLTAVDINSERFFKGLNDLIKTIPMSDWQIYLRWRVLNAYPAMLPEGFRKANFEFYKNYLKGQKEMKPRWKTCVDTVDNGMGEALGREYVDEKFKGNSKKRVEEMIGRIGVAMGNNLKNSTWMSAETKEKALEKLSKITNKIGYPDHWRDYSSLVVSPAEAFQNEVRSHTFESNRILAQVGQPTDKSEWFMTPPTVNAYYDPSQNNINFPAGILQKPFYDRSNDDAVNYGGIGAVIGHEITHGFDDQGADYDGDGNLKNWWTPKDKANFDFAAKGLLQQYAGFVVGGEHVNGELTLGENIADNGGIRLAYAAYMSTDPKDVIDGFTPQQRFFIGFAQVWCSNIRPKAAEESLKTDPHSPMQYRVNGTVMNNPEFAKAFGCKVGDAMTPQSARVW